MLHRRLVGHNGIAIDDCDWGVDDIPQLVWPCALPEHLRHSTKPVQRILRAVVSMILIRMCTDASDWAEVGSALGLPSDKSRNWTRYAFSSRSSVKHALLRSADRLSHVLLDQPQRSRWTTRPRIQGFGVGSLVEAQAPECVGAGGAWCPCLQMRNALRPTLSANVAADGHHGDRGCA